MGIDARFWPRTHQNFMRMVPLKIQWSTGTPALVEGNFDATLVDTGTGDVTITMLEPGGRAPTVICTAESTSGKLFAVVKSATASTIEILTYSDAGTATDSGYLHVLVCQYDSPDVN